MHLSGPLGAVAMPSALVLASHSEISRRCEAYAREKAGDELLAGKAPDLTALQRDIDACADRLDTGRQLLQALILTIGLGVAGYFGMKTWRRR
jgi:hypothetical protein